MHFSSFFRRLLILIALAALLSGCSLNIFSSRPAPTVTLPPTSAAFSPATCPFKLGPGIVDGQQVNCGYLTVPEDRSHPGSPNIKLAVAIFKSPLKPSDPAPILYLDGGPGGASLAGFGQVISATNLSFFVSNHDLILFDQRGVGYSQPSLQCPELTKLSYDTLAQRLNRAAQIKLQNQAALACHDRLVKSGVALSTYNTLENAADVHALVQALGYKQVTLDGASYGTRLALTVMHLFPTGIRSVVLDSVVTPQENRTTLPASGERAFETLFKGCASDPHCNTAYPNLRTAFYDLVTTFNQQPITFKATDDLHTGKEYTVLLTGNDAGIYVGNELVFLLFSALYDTQLIGQLPAMIFQAHKGDYTLLAKIFGQVGFPDPTFSDGMFYSANCSEDYAFTTPQAFPTATHVLPPEAQPAFLQDLQDEYSICQIWHVKPVPATQKQPVTSAIPTLVLSGEYDPITPPQNGKAVAQTLSNSFYFLFPGTGHGEEYTSSCAYTIVHTFEDNPTQQSNSSCLARLGEPPFQ